MPDFKENTINENEETYDFWDKVLPQIEGFMCRKISSTTGGKYQFKITVEPCSSDKYRREYSVKIRKLKTGFVYDIYEKVYTGFPLDI